MIRSSSYPLLGGHVTPTDLIFRSVSLCEIQHKILFHSSENRHNLDSHDTFDVIQHLPSDDSSVNSDFVYEAEEYTHGECENHLPGSRRRRNLSAGSDFASSDSQEEFYEQVYSSHCTDISATNDKESLHSETELPVLDTDSPLDHNDQLKASICDSLPTELNPPVEKEEDGVDADKDVSNPAYVPRNGNYFMHDFRMVDLDKSHEDDVVTKGRADRGQWQHDLFHYYDQTPPSRFQIIRKYGYDIRDEKPEQNYKHVHRNADLPQSNQSFRNALPSKGSDQVTYQNPNTSVHQRLGRFTKSHHESYEENCGKHSRDAQTRFKRNQTYSNGYYAEIPNNVGPGRRSVSFSKDCQTGSIYQSQKIPTKDYIHKCEYGYSGYPNPMNSNTGPKRYSAHRQYNLPTTVNDIVTSGTQYSPVVRGSDGMPPFGHSMDRRPVLAKQSYTAKPMSYNHQGYGTRANQKSQPSEDDWFMPKNPPVAVFSK